jgi:hypothetical protein
VGYCGSKTLKNVIEDQFTDIKNLFTKKKEQYTLYAEMTPNPAVMKFVSTKFYWKAFWKYVHLKRLQMFL